MIPAWVGAYVGVPFLDLGRDPDGCDCWGLVRLILAEQAGLALPCWATLYASEAAHERVLGLAAAQKGEGTWRRIDAPDERPFDVVELTQPVRTAEGWRFLPIHAGLVVTPGVLIHVERATAALLADYRYAWSIRSRVAAFWRHRELDDDR